MLQASSAGQVQTSGTALAPRTVEAAPFVVRITLDDADFAKRLPAGSAGTATIYTDHVKPTHVVRRVILRQLATTSIRSRNARPLRRSAWSRLPVGLLLRDF